MARDLSSQSSTYGPAVRLLHALALERPFVAETWLDLEELIHGRGLAAATGGRHVFVTGLARAGTTMLMRLLHASGQFASLSYRDMPFVLAPNLWASLTSRSRRDIPARERAHGDGVLVDADSPEALDEVFWRVICGSAYIRPETLVPMEANDDAVERFRRYVALILKRYGSNRYLSKNNNNLLRLPSIRRAFPNAHLIVPFRDPLHQASSLLTQHRRFSQQQRDDPFTRRYMTWLVHPRVWPRPPPVRVPGQPLAGRRRPRRPGVLAAAVGLHLHASPSTGQRRRRGSDLHQLRVDVRRAGRRPRRSGVTARHPGRHAELHSSGSPTDAPAIADRTLVDQARDLHATLRRASSDLENRLMR